MIYLDELEVANWYPTPDASGKPQQVHLLVKLQDGVTLAVRFKTPRGLDELIQALHKHRREVFGDDA